MIAADAAGQIVGYGMVGWLAIAATLTAMVFVGQIHMHTGASAARPGT
jgi:hypothetical protein